MMGTTAGNGTSRANEHHCCTRRLEEGVSASSGTGCTMPERIKAIGLDANVVGKHVEPNVTTIEKWSDACASHGAQIMELGSRGLGISSKSIVGCIRNRGQFARTTREGRRRQSAT